MTESRTDLSTRTAMQLALRLREAKPGKDEGDLAIAAWQRCVCALDRMGLLHPDDRRPFHMIADSEGID